MFKHAIVAGVCFAMSAAVPSADGATPGPAVAVSEPILATPFQLHAEQMAMRIMARPAVKAAVAKVKERLLSDPAAFSREGRAMLDRALSLWLADLTLREIVADPARPQIIMSPTIRPRTWQGYTFPGSGIAGDSPDNVQRSTFLDGRYSYELTGALPLNNRSAQFTLAFTPDFRTSFGIGKPNALPYNRQLSMLRDDTIQIGRDGRFTITMDATPANGRPNHVQLPPTTVDIWFRESLSDWKQVPTTWSIRRTDSLLTPPAMTEDQIAQRAAAEYSDWVAHWAKHKETFFNHPPVNTLPAPMYRQGGFGYISYGFYDLKPDEAIIATADNGGAKYSSFQVLDRWYLAADHGPAPSSRNDSQTTQNSDGTVTYVLSLKDPGAPNWIDAAGISEGIVLMRWQALPDRVAPQILDYRLVKLRDIKSLLPAETKWVTLSERAAEIAVRVAEIDARFAH